MVTGPRAKQQLCATHKKRADKATSQAQKEKHVLDTFELEAEDYDDILEAQGGVCYICHKPPGRKYRLAVDHDHAKAEAECDHDPKTKGCKNCVRGLLHRKPCNLFLGWIGDEPEAGIRIHDYLKDPPARRVLGNN